MNATVIGMPEERYEEYKNGSDFIRKHIFPGGHLPCFSVLETSCGLHGLEISECFDIGKVWRKKQNLCVCVCVYINNIFFKYNFKDYAVTLKQWRENFEKKKQAIIGLGYSEEFYKKWIFYFVYCQVSFLCLYIYIYIHMCF